MNRRSFFRLFGGAAAAVTTAAYAKELVVDGSITASRIKDAAISDAYIVSMDAAKIRITGSETLSDWRQSGDETKISGGKISAGHISISHLRASDLVIIK